MAEALRLTKNDPSLSSNPQKPLVFYIGDPALKLSIGKPNIRLLDCHFCSSTSVR